MDVLKDQEAVRHLSSILKTNVHACKALGKSITPFHDHLFNIALLEVELIRERILDGLSF